MVSPWWMLRLQESETRFCVLWWKKFRRKILPVLSVLKLEAVHSFETLVPVYQIIRCHIHHMNERHIHWRHVQNCLETWAATLGISLTSPFSEGARHIQNSLHEGREEGRKTRVQFQEPTGHYWRKRRETTRTWWRASCCLDDTIDI
jgi:hypothetical protein